MPYTKYPMKMWESSLGSIPSQPKSCPEGWKRPQDHTCHLQTEPSAGRVLIHTGDSHQSVPQSGDRRDSMIISLGGHFQGGQEPWRWALWHLGSQNPVSVPSPSQRRLEHPESAFLPWRRMLTCWSSSPEAPCLIPAPGSDCQLLHFAG